MKNPPKLCKTSWQTPALSWTTHVPRVRNSSPPLPASKKRHAATERMVEQMRVSLPETFKCLASEVLAEKSKHFSEQNQTSLGRVLEPLKMKLEDFQAKIEAARIEQIRGGEKLSAHIDKLLSRIPGSATRQTI